MADRVALKRVLDYLYGPGRRLSERVYQANRDDALIAPDVRHAVDSHPADEWLAPEDRRFIAHRNPNPDAFERALTDFMEQAFHRAPEIIAEIRQATPQAIVAAFSKAAAKDGTVSRQDISRVLGQRAATLFKEIEQGLERAPTPRATRRELQYSYLDDVSQLRVGESIKPSVTAAQLPALAAVSAAVGGPSKLEGFDMVAVQHLFASTVPLFEELARNGLDPKRSQILGKSYSTNPDVWLSLKASAFSIDDQSRFEPFRPDVDASQTLERRALDKLDQMFAGKSPDDPNGHYLLLDEGGSLVKMLHLHHPQFAHRCVAVEQTEHGIGVLKELEKSGTPLRCPVVNVAQSEAKKVLEAKVIGESVATSIEAQLSAVGPGGLSIAPREAAVVGYGAVGTAVAQSLRARGYAVFVYDKDPQAMERARRDGFVTGPRDQMLAHGHLTVSATGMSSLPVEDHRLLPNHAVIANAGSNNGEVGTVDPFKGQRDMFRDADGFLVDTFKGRSVRLGDATAGMDQALHRVEHGRDGSERLLLRNGFVVNLVEDIPPQFIQLTRALLLGACLQASQLHTKGFVDLDAKVQSVAERVTRESLAVSGLSLDSPRLDGKKGV